MRNETVGRAEDSDVEQGVRSVDALGTLSRTILDPNITRTYLEEHVRGFLIVTRKRRIKRCS